MVSFFEQLKKTYAGKKVFVTGHTGFKGAWLVNILHMLGAVVKGFALETKTADDLFNLINGEKLCHSCIGDIRNKENLSKEVLSFDPDFIFHLAAQPLVRLSYQIPAETFEVNLIGTANLLDAVRQLKNTCQLVLITTDKVYHNNEWVYPYRENDRLGGYDPYSASKACTELLIDSYRNSFFNLSDYGKHLKSISVARAGNVIGGGDWNTDRLIPDIARSLSTDQSIEIRNPYSVRPWQHVLEPLTGYLLLGMKLQGTPLQYSQAYNFGPNTEDTMPVEKIVQLAIESWGKGTYHTSVGHAAQLHEAGLLKLDISKVTAELNWKPRLSTAKAVEMSIDWYKVFYQDRAGILDFTEKQIRDFI